MNYYALIPLTAFFINTCFLVYIFAQKRSNDINRAYMWFLLPLSFWALADFFLWNTTSEVGWILPLLRLEVWIWAPVGFLYLRFIFIFIKRKPDLIYRILQAVIIIMVVPAPFTSVVSVLYRRTTWGIIHESGILYDYYVYGLIVLPTIYSVYLMFKALKSSKSPLFNRQLVLLQAGVVIHLLGGILNNVIIPNVLHIPDVVQLGSSTIVITAFFSLLAVTKYNFLSVDVQQAAQDLFDRVSDGVILADNTGKVIQINNVTRKLFKSMVDNKDLTIAMVFGAKSGADTVFELSYKEGDKNYIVSVAPGLLREKDVELGKIFIIRDITDLKEQESILIQREKMAILGDVVASVAHDITTPLLAISMGFDNIGPYVETLQKYYMANKEKCEDKDFGKMHRYYQKTRKLMVESMDQIRDHISNLKAFIKFQEFTSDFDINEEIKTTLKILAFKIPSRITVETSLSQVPKLTGNAAHINQVIMNLIYNSIEGMQSDQKGMVRIATFTEGKAVVLEIEDDGPGIPEDVQKKLFVERITTKDKGTGLGLALCKKIIEEHGWEILLVSQIGRGTKVRIVCNNKGEGQL